MKLFELITFDTEESFLDFYQIYNRFCFKILRPIQQKLDMVNFGQF